MDISCYRTILRKDFGCPIYFDDCDHEELNFIPDHTLLENYIAIEKAQVGCLCSCDISAHEVNTQQFPVESCGMQHKEGGWPADVDHRDEDQVARFKKKIEKDENYVRTILKLGETMEQYIMENNALDIYEEYFCDEPEEDEEVSAKILNVFRDYNIEQRAVFDISFSSEGSPRLAVAYSVKEFQNATINLCKDSYVWDIDNINQPWCILKTNSFLSCVEYCPRDANSVAGGCNSGQVVLWDARKGGMPEKMTAFSNSHRAPVSDIKWLNSKCGCEFLSVSTDGKVISWDARNLTKPTQTLHLDSKRLEQAKDIPMLNKSYGITSLHYDFSLPYRYMLGTEQGTVLSCNRRPKTPADLIPGIYNTSLGPVFSVDRNPYFTKHFAAVGAWAVMIWCEDTRDVPLLTLSSGNGYITDGIWSPMRPSVLFITKTTGDFEIWDLLSKHNEPTLSIKLENEGLNCVRCNERGDRVAVGTLSGAVHLLQTGQSFLGISKYEKNVLASMLDREGKHGKLLQGKTREQRLKQVAREQLIEDIARRKLYDMEESSSTLTTFEDQWQRLADYERQAFSQEEMNKFYEETARRLKIERESGESEFLEKLSKEAQTSRALQHVLDTVSEMIEKDSSHFPLIKMDLPDEYGEEAFVDQMDHETGCAETLEKLLRQASGQSSD